MIRIDGGVQSGSGTIVRFATALAAVTGQPLHIVNARAKRPQPGLRPQHVSAVRACAELCGARIDGVAVGSRELTFEPGATVRSGSFAWDIGTAGSTTMLALAILPIATRAGGPITARITGGVFQDFAPSAHHLQHVLIPLLARMGMAVELDVQRAGYVPAGGGVIELHVAPLRRVLRPLVLTEQGTVRGIQGIAFSSHLDERRVSERMAAACEEHLTACGLACSIERVSETLAARPGASLALWAHTSTGCILGADQAGAPRRRAEAIGHFVATTLLEDLATGATLDRHAADQLVPFAALAAGRTQYLAPAVTDHLVTNLWLVEQFGARVHRDDRQVTIEGLASR